MTTYILRLLAGLVPLTLRVETLVSPLIHLIPGDPVDMMLGEGVPRRLLERRKLKSTGTLGYAGAIE
jgi:ABC-type dipeptide/oligopeptide/nickel transport system permease component